MSPISTLCRWRATGWPNLLLGKALKTNRLISIIQYYTVLNSIKQYQSAQSVSICLIGINLLNRYQSAWSESISLGLSEQIRTYRLTQNQSAYSEPISLLRIIQIVKWKKFQEINLFFVFFFRFPKMISRDGYRLSIGYFDNSSLQLNLRTICRGLKIGIC